MQKTKSITEIQNQIKEIDEQVYLKLVDCLEKCLIYGHIRRFAN